MSNSYYNQVKACSNNNSPTILTFLTVTSIRTLLTGFGFIILEKVFPSQTLTFISIKYSHKRDITSLHKACLDLPTFIILSTLAFLCSLNCIMASPMGLVSQCKRLPYQRILGSSLFQLLTILSTLRLWITPLPCLCQGLSQGTLALWSIFISFNLPNQ